MSALLPNQQLETQVLKLLSLCDATLKRQCDPAIGEPPQIQAIQTLHQLHTQPEQLSELWCRYHDAVQERIAALYELMSSSRRCEQEHCPLAHRVCEPKEHYFVLIAMLQDLQAWCELCHLPMEAKGAVRVDELRAQDFSTNPSTSLS